MKILLRTYLILTVLLYGCSGEPAVNFEEPVKGKSLNLSKEIGDSIFVTENIDTLEYTKYTFIYDGEINLIIKNDADTVFLGTATKRKELILLNRVLENGKYAIHAIELTDSTIKGLETEWLQSILIDSITKSPNYSKIITDTNQVKTIDAKKKDAKNIFRWVIDQLEPLYIIDPYKIPKSVMKEERMVAKEESPSTKFSKLVKTVYPNPFETILKIKMNINSTFRFQFHNSAGEQLINEQKTGDSFEFDLSNEQDGFIYLSVFDLTNKNPISAEKIKLIKK